jgi:uncharacterized Tic20 family protein
MERPEKPELSQESQRLLATVSHIAAIPFEFFAPLVSYFLLRKRGEFVASQARESLNFSITVFILLAVLYVSVLGWALLWLPPLLAILLRSYAAFKVFRGEQFKFPATLRLIKK